MPEHFYTGEPGRYPVLRDSTGLLVGDVKPGDTRDFGEPPDPHWLPVEGNEDHAALTGAREPAAAGTGEGRSEEEGGESPAVAAMRRARREPNAAPPVPGTATPAADADASGQTPQEQP